MTLGPAITLDVECLDLWHESKAHMNSVYRYQYKHGYYSVTCISFSWYKYCWKQLGCMLDIYHQPIGMSALEFSNRVSRISPKQWCGTTQWAVHETFESANKAERYMFHSCTVSDWLSNLFELFLLVTLPHMNWYRYLYTKNYRAVKTYHQVFCYPESVNTKQENNDLQCKLYTLYLNRVLWELDKLCIWNVSIYVRSKGFKFQPIIFNNSTVYILLVCNVHTYIYLCVFILVCDPVMGDNGAMVCTYRTYFLAKKIEGLFILR